MRWQDILKETVTQSRVKEIEDIDIDIEDDDCLRWLKQLQDIIVGFAKKDAGMDNLTDNNVGKGITEAEACEFKEAIEKTLVVNKKGDLSIPVSSHTRIEGSNKRGESIVRMGLSVVEEEGDPYRYERTIKPYLSLSLRFMESWPRNTFEELDESFIEIHIERVDFDYFADSDKNLFRFLERLYRHCSWDFTGTRRLMQDYMERVRKIPDSSKEARKKFNGKYKGGE